MAEGQYVSNKLLGPHFVEVRQWVCSVRVKLLFIVSQPAPHAHLFCIWCRHVGAFDQYVIATTSRKHLFGTKSTNKLPPSYGQ